MERRGLRLNDGMSFYQYMGVLEIVTAFFSVQSMCTVVTLATCVDAVNGSSPRFLGRSFVQFV